MSGLGLAGKIAIVTGAGRGLGFAFAKGLADEGAKVVVADINGDAASEVAKNLSANGAKAFPSVVNVADENSVVAMVDQVISAFGCVDVLVNNAGVYAGLKRKPF